MANKEVRMSREQFAPAIMDATISEAINKPSISFWQDSWMRVRKNKAALVSMILIVLIFIFAWVGPLISGHGLDDQNLKRTNLPAKIPVLENVSWLPFDGTRTMANGNVVDVYEQKNIEERYWFGTDGLGRDVLTRVAKGIQISLYIAFLAALLDMLIGVAYGAISGYYGGKLDNVMQRIVEVVSGVPNLVVVILMILVFKPGIMSITIALAITSWTSMSRVVRAQVMKLKEQEFVLASRTLGSSNYKIILKHLLPNLASVIIINTMFTIPSAIFFEAFLSFIGLGLQSPLASLGTLINDGFKTIRLYPHLMLFPAFFISLIMVCFNMIADGLRDALDPKMRD